MKTADKICAQGDALFIRVKALPAGVVKATGPEANVVAHSETGHHHVALGADVYFVPSDPMICYLQLTTDASEIRHLRPHDTHESIALGGGAGAVYQVRRQREWTPAGMRRVED